MFVDFERCGLNTKFSTIKTHIFGLRRNLMTANYYFFSCITIKMKHILAALIILKEQHLVRN